MYPYHYNTVVSDYDCDALLRFSPSAVLRYMQTAATDHLTKLSLPYELLQEMGIAFILSAVAVKFHGELLPKQNVCVATGPVPAKGVQLIRQTDILDMNGNVIIEGQSSWVMVSPTTGQILRPRDYPLVLPPLEKWEPFYDPTRMKISQDCEFAYDRPVRLSDIDRNQHVNNTIYADILADTFSEELYCDCKFDSFYLKYKTQAKLKETISISKNVQGNLLFAQGNIGNSLCFEGKLIIK